MFNITLIKLKSKKRSAFPLNRKYGILRCEMFVVKSMDSNSNLLRLKLDMVYRDLPVEEAQKKFEDLKVVPPETAVVEAPKPKRKTVKALLPKNK